MKPAQIALLVVLGAIGGAIATKVAQRPATPPAVAVSQPQEPVAASTPPPAPAPAAEEPVPPSAVEAPAKPEPVRRPHVAKSRPKPISSPAQVARNEPPPPPAVMTPPAPSAAEPAAPTVIVSEPVRPEPEHVTPAPRPPEPHMVTLNAGILLPVRLVDGLSSDRNMSGDTFTATLDKELVVDGFVIAERGARVEGKVVASDRGGKVKGVAAIAVELTRLHTSDGQALAIHTDSFERHAEQSQREDAAKVGGGAALGAIIGAIAGGGKGAAIGAGAGGAAGAGGVLLTRGKTATLPSETRISFRLNSPVTVTERR